MDSNPDIFYIKLAYYIRLLKIYPEDTDEICKIFQNYFNSVQCSCSRFTFIKFYFSYDTSYFLNSNSFKPLH